VEPGRLERSAERTGVAAEHPDAIRALHRLTTYGVVGAGGSS
jgi:hypothetical protein